MTIDRRLVLVLGLTQTLAWATTYYIPAVIVGAAAATLHHSTTELLVGYSWSLLVAGLISPRVGARIDRSGGRGVMATGTVVMAAGLLVLAAWPDLVGWYVAWTIIGAGMAMGLYDAAFASIGRLLGMEARRAIVGVTLLAGFASTIGWPVGVALIHRFDWRITAVIYAAIQLAVNLPLILALIPRAAPAPRPQADDAPPEAAVRGTFFALILLGGFFCARAAISSVVSVHALTLLHGVGLTAVAAVGIAALFGPSQVFGRLLEWVFARWIDPLTGSWMGAALLPAGVVALLLGAPVITFAVAYGISNGIQTISRGTLPMFLFGPRGYATRLGRLALPQLLVQAVAPTAVAPLVLTLPATTIFAGIGIVAFAGFLCLLPLKGVHAPPALAGAQQK
jgi:MFS family permease